MQACMHAAFSTRRLTHTLLQASEAWPSRHRLASCSQAGTSLPRPVFKCSSLLMLCRCRLMLCCLQDGAEPA